MDLAKRRTQLSARLVTLGRRSSSGFRMNRSFRQRRDSRLSPLGLARLGQVVDCSSRPG